MERGAEESKILAGAVANADRVVVVVGSSYDARNRKTNDVIARTNESVALDALLDALRTGPGERMDWMTLGSPTLAFLNGTVLLAAVQCLLPDYIRCPGLWSGDAPLRDPAALERWLDTYCEP